MQTSNNQEDKGKIVLVKFGTSDTPRQFKGREYAYYTKVDLSVGDVIVVPVKNGNTAAIVCKTDVSPTEIDERVEKYMRTIEEVVRPQEKQQCRVCGCTEDRACPGGCSWVEKDLCSACTDTEEAQLKVFDNEVYEQQRKNIERLAAENPDDWFYKSQMELPPNRRTGFAPSTPRCHNCGKDITQGEKGITLERLGNYIITGCPHCYRSYCE